MIQSAIYAQDARFKAGLTGGFTASQIEGDDLAGYQKLGYVIGLRGTTLLSEKTEINLELLYSKNGSNRGPDQFVPFNVGIDLNYIKVPVLFHYKDWLQEELYHKVHFLTGFYYGYLISSGITELPINPDNFKQNEWGYILGANFFVNAHFGIGLRYERAVTKLLRIPSDPNLSDLIPYNFAFHAIYLF